MNEKNQKNLRRFHAELVYQLGPAQIIFSTPIFSKNPYEAIEQFEKVLDVGGYPAINSDNSILSVEIREELEVEEFSFHTRYIHPFLSE